ncbi:phage tail protein [Evtepia gabavorous]|uniref:phage tail protein n=1 Tax=Evtepia gabavorous TaxID=2211183 RepID=UPI003A913901
MSVFRIFVDGQLFYHPHLSQLSITEAKVQEDAENIDSLTLSAPFNHPYLSAIRPMASTIVCKKDDLTVFEGRALDDGTDFYNTHTWTCESCLAYLKDTMQPPFSYQGPLRGLLEQFLSVHNAAVEEKKRFTLGTVTVTDNNDYISYSNSDYSVTLDAIQDKLIKTHGGYLQVHYTEDGKVLDYLEDFPDRSLQTVEFGKNLTDVKITRDHTERVTVLIPLGAKLTETDEDGNETETDTRLDITAVNDGKNYVYDEEAVKEIGWIWTTEVWEDVTLAGNLLRKAKARIAELAKGVTSMELTIVDESDTGADIGDIRARMYVRCISKPHGIDGTYLCLSRTRDYLDPSGNTITIGAAGVRLTSQSAKQEQNITSIKDDLLGQTSKIEDMASKVEQIPALQENIRECYSEITKTSEEINLSVREEFISRSELETIQKDFETSITQNSTEIRMDFTAITDEIKENVSTNQLLLEEYIRFKGALIELGKVGNAFTAELSNEELAFKENGQKIAYISNQSLVITNAEIRNKLSLGNESRGWFDFIPRTNGNLSIKWRGPV